MSIASRIELEKLNKSDKAKAWLFCFLDSLRADLRLDGKHITADRLRKKMKDAFGYESGDLTLNELRDYREGLRLEKNMPNASIVELEMF